MHEYTFWINVVQIAINVVHAFAVILATISEMRAKQITQRYRIVCLSYYTH